MVATPKNFMDFSQEIEGQLREAIAVKEEMLSRDVQLIADLARLLSSTFKGGKKAVIFGNGGSAADAQHVATELVNRFEMERGALPVIALTTDTSMLTAVGNDYSFERIFARQVEALVEEGDVAIGISASGRSANVLKGLEAAREKGAVTVGFTGRDGGQLKDVADLCYCAPSERTARIQEAHITAWHIICYLVERELFA
jgi:D-sedoheptulose 7-phosphate isomerase